VTILPLLVQLLMRRIPRLPLLFITELPCSSSLGSGTRTKSRYRVQTIPLLARTSEKQDYHSFLEATVAAEVVTVSFLYSTLA
jgi:hypothetical protein